MKTCSSTSQRDPEKSTGTRITVTIPPGDYQAVRQIAKEKKVSASWVVRDAVEKYVQDSSH
jgi:metal-responsive CopG/Arc/MetJ family transcriptional regulator